MQLAKKPMDKAEAKAAVTQINNNMMSAAAVIVDFHDREGWKALGYKSWKECAEKEFEMTRQRTYQLLDHEKIKALVSTTVDDAPELDERATRELKHVPESRIPEVVRQAAATAKGEGKAAPTSAHIRQAAAPHKTAPKPAKSEVKHLPSEKKNLDDAAYKKALSRINDICGKDARKAIETGAVSMSRADVLLFAKQRDNVMGDIQELVLAQRWKVAKAIKFVNKMPDEKTKLGDLFNLAIAAGGTWEGTINHFGILVTAPRKKR